MKEPLRIEIDNNHLCFVYDNSLSHIVVRGIYNYHGMYVYVSGPESVTYEEAKHLLEKMIWRSRFMEEKDLRGLERWHFNYENKERASEVTDLCPAGLITEVEGYKVHFRTPKKNTIKLCAEVVHHQGEVFINVNGPDWACSKDNVISFVEQRLDMILEEDISRTETYVGGGIDRFHIDNFSFSTVNRRNDIVDDEYVKEIKRKWKSSTIESPYSTLYAKGRPDIPEEGTPVVNHEGRLVPFEKKEEQFREQK